MVIRAVCIACETSLEFFSCRVKSWTLECVSCGKHPDNVTKIPHLSDNWGYHGEKGDPLLNELLNPQRDLFTRNRNMIDRSAR